MKHLGDITKLSGYVVQAVDVVIGGSPCQGLSVAGKQAGLKDERSGLFIEQIRLVKEMRKADAARALVMVSNCLEREFIHRQLATGQPLHMNVL